MTPPIWPGRNVSIMRKAPSCEVSCRQAQLLRAHECHNCHVQHSAPSSGCSSGCSLSLGFQGKLSTRCRSQHSSSLCICPFTDVHCRRKHFQHCWAHPRSTGTNVSVFLQPNNMAPEQNKESAFCSRTCNLHSQLLPARSKEDCVAIVVFLNNEQVFTPSSRIRTRAEWVPQCASEHAKS